MRDLFINYCSGLGVPKILFKLATLTSEFDGAAAITSRLKEVSLNIGMEEGIGVFVGIGILSHQTAAYYVKRFYQKKVSKDRLVLRLSNVQAVLNHIDTYPISSTLKKKLKTTYLIPNS